MSFLKIGIIFNILPIKTKHMKTTNFFEFTDKIFNSADKFLDSFSNLNNYNSFIDQNDTAYLIEISLPGFNKEDINIELQGNYLILSYDGIENKWKSKFKNTYKLSEIINDSDISAKFNNGILIVSINKNKLNTIKKITIE